MEKNIVMQLINIKKLVELKDTLFDVSATDENRKKGM